MNVLTNKLPTKIRVNNNIYNINYDYKTIINIILAFEDKELTNSEQVYILLKNLYKEEIHPKDTYEAMKKGLKFIDGGEESDTEDDIKPKRIYSFKKDGNYIFSGINQTHHINLSENENMHWWIFLSLFMDMSTDCTFGELVYYRKRKNENKLTKEEKEQYKKIKKLIDLDEKDKVPSQARKEFLDKFRELNKK